MNASFRTFASVTIVCILYVGSVLALAAPFWGNQGRLEVEISDLELDISRLEEDLREAQPKQLETAIPEALLWRDQEATGTAIAMQEKVVQLAQVSDIAVTSFGAGYDPIGTHSPTTVIEVEAEGALSALFLFLSELESSAPPFAISQLEIRPSDLTSNVPDSGAPALSVSVRMTVWAFTEEDA